MKTKLIMLACIVFITSCNETYEKERPALQEENYQDAKMTVEETERQNPLNFLVNSGEYRPALVGGDFLVTGFIENHATVATYKDITIEITFYSKTNSVTGTERKIFYEFIGPGKRFDYRFKIWAPQGSKQIGLSIVDAKAQ